MDVFGKKILLVVVMPVFLTSLTFAYSGRQAARARHGMVASASDIASQVGADIMQRGGNAVDASIAVALALAVVWPEAGNLGGGGFMLICRQNGDCEFIDYRERAPLKAHRNLYLDAKGNVIPNASTLGYKAVAVPGTVAGLEMAHQRHGTLPWKDLVEPARKLAAEGFLLNHLNAHFIQEYAEPMKNFPESYRIYQRNGSPYKEGDQLILEDLARTLARLQQHGPREFYEGETAKMIVKDMAKNSGLISAEDLRQYKATLREPLRGTYRGHEIVTAAPPSSGGAVLLEMLNMLELNPPDAGTYHSAGSIHLLIEIMKRAFADRAQYMGDTDFVKVPIAELIEKKYAEKLRATIDLKSATPAKNIRAGVMLGKESANTTHFSIVDKHGNMVANTYTLNDFFGSAVVAEGTGILLNNEMDDFTSKPGVPNLYGLIQGEANSIEPRKRPLSAMTPTIILKDGKPWFALGGRGGPTIINSVLQVILNVIDYGMGLQQAIDAPRFHHQWLPDRIHYERYGISPETRKMLEKMGHVFEKTHGFRTMDHLSDIQAVMIEEATGMRLGASDPRMSGVPAGN